MNKILIVSLGSSKQALSCGYMTPQLRENNPHSEIHLLVLKENLDRVKMLKHITKIHAIDSAKMNQIKKGSIFSDGFALDALYENLEEVLTTEWSQVVNQSHNTLSTLITSALQTESRVGVSLTPSGTTMLSNDWAINLNSVNTQATRKPIETNIINNHLVGAPWINEGEAIKISEQYSLLAGQNFTRIRNMKVGKSKIVGISLSQGYDGTYLETEALTEIVGTLKESSEYIPILLMDPKELNQKTIVNELNALYNNELISINVDFTAFPAITTHLDIIVSPATDYLLAADLRGTIALELRNTEAFKNDPLITNEGSRVIFYNESYAISSEVIYAINEIYSTELPLETTNGGAFVYACVKDEYGYFFSQIKGEISLHTELNYHLSRSFFFHILGYPENQALLNNIKEMCTKDEIHEFVTLTRSELTGVVKILLATLRSMKTMRNTSEGLNSFLAYYDQLLAYGNQDNLIGHLIRFTEGQIENIHNNDAKKNLELIEKSLFDLKSNIQKITETCGILIGDLSVEKTSSMQK